LNQQQKERKKERMILDVYLSAAEKETCLLLL
jgi:hypothetical protein